MAGWVLTMLAICLHLIGAAPFDVDQTAGVDNTMANVARGKTWGPLGTHHVQLPS
jgi:hypothetical protein